MDLVQEAQRSLYASVGAAAWTVDALRTVPEQLGRAWQDRDELLHRARDTYEEFADRGHEIVTEAQEDTQRAARQARSMLGRVPGMAPAEAELVARLISGGELPISEYDSLTAAEVVQKLPTLSQRELREIEIYEHHNRGRATVLSRVDELRSEEPWSGYDDMTVEEILPRMRKAPTAEQASIVAYERRHKQRSTIIDAATS